MLPDIYFNAFHQIHKISLDLKVAFPIALCIWAFQKKLRDRKM